MTAIEAASAREVYYPLGRAGRCSGRRKLFIFVFDDSGSVTGSGGNDPLGNRYAEARHAVRSLARNCTCGRERVTVLHFDASKLDVPPTTLDRGGVAQIQDGLQEPDDIGGSSELLPALRHAELIQARTYWRGHNAHLVVFSDFELLDPRPERVVRRLARFPGRVTTVVLGGAVTVLAGQRRIATVPVSASDQRGDVSRLLFAQLTMGRAGRRLIVESGHG